MKENCEYVELSTKLTIIHKIIFPILVLIGLVSCGLYIRYFTDLWTKLLPALFFSIFLWLLILTHGIRLYRVFYNGKVLKLTNFGIVKYVSVDEIIAVESVPPAYYSIKLADGSSHLFLPHFVETLNSHPKEPKYISEFRNEIGLRTAE